MLTDADLAYMRETQALTRPTAATLQRKTRTPDGEGGYTLANSGAPEPIQVRVFDRDDVPQEIAERYATAEVAKLVCDLVAISEGDVVTTDAARVYDVVSDGDNQEWTTAQIVWAVKRP